MIKNIIFDLGGVLIDFNPENYLKHIGIEKEEIPLLKKLIWESQEWFRGDRGNMNFEQITNSICSNNPKYAQKLRYALENKDNNFILSENLEACEYCKKLKNNGFKIYFLSNVNFIDLKYDKENFEIFNIIDGGVYSCEVGFAKPEIECYQILLDKYMLIPEECIFIDDNIKNINTAISLGINSVHHNNLETTKEKIKSLLLNQ